MSTQGGKKHPRQKEDQVQKTQGSCVSETLWKAMWVKWSMGTVKSEGQPSIRQCRSFCHTYLLSSNLPYI